MKNSKRTSGQSLIEFTLVFPLLIFLIFGLFDLGRAVFFMTTLNTAVREGTRFAIVQPKSVTNADIETHLRGYYFNIEELADHSAITIVRNYLLDDPNVTITITYEFVPITPGIKQLLGTKTGIPLTAESTMLLSPVAK